MTQVALSNPLMLAQTLIRQKSVTPDGAGCLDTIAGWLNSLGFACERLRFGDVDNLYARRGSAAPNFCFAGHVDVVPEGDSAAWTHNPYAGVMEQGVLWGRGAADMKSAIAAFISAVARVEAPVNGSISLLLTSDEEGAAVNGTVKVLETLAARGEKIDFCLVGEPTNPEILGQMAKIGRRGSLNGVLTARGKQGHVAYPDRAANPLPALVRLCEALIATPLDTGNAVFQPSNLELTSLDVGNPVTNVIPATASARFNVRFTSDWTGETLAAELRRRLDAVSMPVGVDYTLETILSGEAFRTAPGALSDAVSASVEAVTGRKPELSTSGGTSDARFIARYCPVVEFGGVGATMHKVDEQQQTADIEALAAIYKDIINRLL